MTQRDANGNGIAMYYTRDIQGRIVARSKNTLTNWTGTDAGSYLYGFTGSGDAPDFVRDANKNLIEKTLQLPGGVTFTINLATTTQTNYSLANIHGDTLLTVNSAGTNTSTGNGPLNSFTYDPFGLPISGSTLPANLDQGSNGWAGKYQKVSESQFTTIPLQMGARLYISGIGRFMQIDPIEGGTPNSYVYPVNPVNDFDLEGTAQKSNFSKQYKNYRPQDTKANYNRSKGLKYNKSDYKSFKKTQEFNQKVWEQSRNSQKRDNNKRGGGPTAPPPLPFFTPPSDSGGQSNGSSKIVVAGGAAAGTGLVVWWTFKLASPVCGPALPVCAVAF